VVPESPPSTASDGLRARKKRLARRAIRDAALRLFIERGYDEVSVEQIASAAMVSRATFFNYFPSKEATLAEPDPEEVAAWSQILDRHADQEPFWVALSDAVVEGLSASEAFLVAHKKIKMSSASLGDMFARSGDWIEQSLSAWVDARIPASESARGRLQLNIAMAALKTAWDDWQTSEPFGSFLDRARTYLDLAAD